MGWMEWDCNRERHMTQNNDPLKESTKKKSFAEQGGTRKLNLTHIHDTALSLVYSPYIKYILYI
jgi:hypothetical protein